MNRENRPVSAWVAIVPLAVLTITLALVIHCFGSGAVDGGSQIALLFSSSIAAALAIGIYRVRWSSLEEAIAKNIHTAGSAIIILLLIGAVAGTWMVSGLVPTLIYYGLKVLHPSIFLGAACLICALVSLLTGSSWTTIATIGVALMGIGRTEGFSDGWIAGAIISGAYFGDKLSALSDTTVLASSSVGVPLFDHIKYMMITTIPSFCIALVVFFTVSVLRTPNSSEQIETIATALYSSFNITPWLFVVPLLTGVLIARRLPALVTLFAAIVLACIALVIFQDNIVAQLGGSGALASFRAVMISCYGSTAIPTGNAALDELVATSGMTGMLNTIWLILCAMCFGGVMKGSGMLDAVTRIFLRFVRRTTSIVGSTLAAGLFCNIATADQYISIIITGNLFRDVYRERGLEDRLLSRTIEDSATVTSVLIPWNSCGMTQSTVLGVQTFTYLPYCIFNIISPITSLLIAIFGYKIVRQCKQNS